MSIINWIIMFLIIFVILVFISISIYIYFLPNPNKYFKPISGILKDITSFNDKNIVNFIKGSEGTLSIFIYLDPTQRTPTLKFPPNKDSGQPENPKDPGINYPVHFNIFSLDSLGSLLSFKQYPGSSSGIDIAEIRISTKNPGNTSSNPNIETFQFKAIPLQKWTCITLTRVGRRYTIFYNNEIITSFRTKYYPNINSSAAWIIGDTKSSGYYAYAMASPNAFVLSDVSKQMYSVSDSRNKPNLPSASVISAFNILSLFSGCPDGIFCYITSFAPSSGINKWSSPFA